MAAPIVAEGQATGSTKRGFHLAVVAGTDRNAAETSFGGQDKELESLDIPTRIAMEKDGFIVTQQIEDWPERIASKKRQLLLEVQASHNGIVADVVPSHFASSHSVHLTLSLLNSGGAVLYITVDLSLARESPDCLVGRYGPDRAGGPAAPWSGY
jgi:hypothetical protein